MATSLNRVAYSSRTLLGILLTTLTFASVSIARAQNGGSNIPSDQQSYAGEISGQIATWKANPAHKCEDLASAQTEANQMKSEDDSAYSLKDSPDVTNLERENYRNGFLVGTPIFLGSYLDLADAYLSGGCLDDSDKIYRSVVGEYTGEAYQGFRDRAKIGIDDVRSRRSSAASK